MKRFNRPISAILLMVFMVMQIPATGFAAGSPGPGAPGTNGGGVGPDGAPVPGGDVPEWSRRAFRSRGQTCPRASHRQAPRHGPETLNALRMAVSAGGLAMQASLRGCHQRVERGAKGNMALSLPRIIFQT